MKFDIWVFLENLSRKFQFHWNSTKIIGTLHEDQYTFLITSRSVIPTVINVADKSCRENQNTRLYSIAFVENRAVYEIMWKNTEQLDRSQMTVWRMRISRWIPKATNKQSQYLMLPAFPLQQWLHETSVILRCTYIACVVISVSVSRCILEWQ
jgi:hypothetical protein